MAGPFIWSSSGAKALTTNAYNSAGVRFALISDVTAGAAPTPESKNASFTAAAAKIYLCDTSANTITATLPSGAANAQIIFMDAEQSWATYNLTVTPASGQKIMGLAVNESMICDVSGAFLELVWDATNSWWVPRSNGAVNSAAVEYAANNGTWDSNDSTSFVTGSSGVLMGGSLTNNRTKRVRFPTAIQSTDEIVVEVSDNQVTWVPASMGTLSGGFQIIQGVTSDGSATSGVWLQKTSVATDVDVIFGRYMFIANDDLPVGGWPSANAYWRVRKTSGRSVSYPEVVPGTSAGLVAAQGLKGQTNGVAIAAGYVGEKVAGSGIATSTATFNASLTATSQISLTAGIWQLHYVGSAYFTGAPASGTQAAIEAFFYNATDAAANGNLSPIGLATNPSDADESYNNAFALCDVVNVSSTKLFEVRIRTIAASGTPTGCGCGSRSSVVFYAVRIA